jgi:hypothetical protein
MANQEHNPAEALHKAAKQLTALIEANGGVAHT